MCASASENDTLSQLIGVAQSLITAGNEDASGSVSGGREENYVSTEDLLQEGENSTEENGGADQALIDGGNSYNILLVGSDRRDDSWNGNSDTMILVTVNYDSSRISMVSFMRDLGVDIPGNGTQKLNAAFAVGGISLLEDTLRTNFNVRIDNYAAVDFYEMIDIIDSLGGVNMEVRDEEVDVVNMYIMSMCPYMGLNENDYLLSSGGYLHLNGMQAVAFCRVRFVGDNDYERTERQRRVLTALLGSFNPGSPDDVTALLKELLIKKPVLHLTHKAAGEASGSSPADLASAFLPGKSTFRQKAPGWSASHKRKDSSREERSSALIPESDRYPHL